MGPVPAAEQTGTLQKQKVTFSVKVSTVMEESSEVTVLSLSNSNEFYIFRALRLTVVIHFD